MHSKNSILYTLALMLVSACLLKYGLSPILHSGYPVWLIVSTALIILITGAAYPLTKAAGIIESVTDILSKKSGLSAGLIQSLGTAFPDMILGVTAAIISLSFVKDDPEKAISFALIAAATTFGSNIYNVGHAIWCIYRQNKSDKLNQSLLMFPGLKKLGTVKPLSSHKKLPGLGDMDNAIHLLTILSILTAAVALAMVAFGKITPTLFQLVRPAGVVLFFVTGYILYSFRQKPGHVAEAEAAGEQTPFTNFPEYGIWLALVIAGITIAFTAESMVKSLEVVSAIAGIPYVLSGALAGLIGCLGEMIVIHNYSIHQNGRLGDAIVGVTMDNIVTIMGASIVSIIGGIFLGGTSLIILFVLILVLNGILVDQISTLKTTVIKLR